MGKLVAILLLAVTSVATPGEVVRGDPPVDATGVTVTCP